MLLDAGSGPPLRDGLREVGPHRGLEHRDRSDDQKHQQLVNGSWNQKANGQDGAQSRRHVTLGHSDDGAGRAEQLAGSGADGRSRDSDSRDDSSASSGFALDGYHTLPFTPPDLVK